MTGWMVEEELKIRRETVPKILVEDLGKWKICSKFVLHSLTDE
jgi:hypothetical protein